ncbi:hypothetical protein [Nitrosomonas sp. Is37]|uniref:hypothetical protein n=1 Tax=Nitrosomonas sp. Is37 TaxID=3080535 RepID=UPI00294AC140|nr:hypothetical protein [Nitrosomonas sp. Is37]MDV6345186.1 hypothetical protein [Nitrosomonas sp. Is37]
MNLLQMMSASELVRQAGDAAETYLNYAARAIDTRLGDGYASKHPELVAAFMQVCVQDFEIAIRFMANQSGDYND